jgi:uncharacterized protein YbjT (DUF2867 family)
VPLRQSQLKQFVLFQIKSAVIRALAASINANKNYQGYRYMTNSLEEKIVLVTGATGKQGGAVAKHLLQSSRFRLRVLVRDANKLAVKALHEEGAEIVVGDLDDRASLERSLDGVYGVYSVQVYRDGKNGESAIDNEIRQGKMLADVAASTGVQHFVYSSVGSADRHTEIPHFESKWQIEEYIRAIKLPYTILRPVFLMENWESNRSSIFNGTLSQPLDPDKPLQQVTVDDVGAFAALAFQHPDKWLNREIDLAGDELTMLEAAQVFSRVIGQQVNYEQVPWQQFREFAGEEITTMYQWFNNVGYSADIAAVRREYTGTKTLEQYLRTNGWENARVAQEAIA